MVLQRIVAHLHPANGGAKNVDRWRCILYAVTADYGAVEWGGGIEIAQLSDPVDVVAGPSEGDVTFDFRDQDVRPKRVTPADPNEIATLTDPTTYVVIYALKSDGTPATNVGWAKDSTKASVTTAGNIISGRQLDQNPSGRWEDSSSTGTPRVTVDASTYSAATVTFSGSNKPDLGAVPSSAGDVEFTVRGEIPAGAAITAQARVGGADAWVTVKDGDTATDAGLAASQTYQMRATLTPPASGDATPILVTLGIREVTRINLSFVATVSGGGWGFDPATLKARVAEIEIRATQDGERDFRDAITDLFATTHIGDLWFRIFIAADDLPRHQWYHVDDFYPEHQHGVGGALVIRAVNVLGTLKAKLPKYDAGLQQRQLLTYSNQSLKAVFNDLQANQLAIPGRHIGTQVEDASTLVTKRIDDSDGKVELDAIAFLAGGIVLGRQGRIDFVDVHGAKGVEAVFGSADITQQLVTPGWSQRIPEYFVNYDYDFELQRFKGQHRAFHADAITKLGRTFMDPPQFLDEEISKWIPTQSLASTIGTRQVGTLGTGMITVGYRAEYPHSEIWPGSLVLVRTDRLVARSPTDDRAIKAYTWVAGVVTRREDILGLEFEIWVRRYSDILGSSNDVTLDQLPLPSSSVLGYDPRAYGATFDGVTDDTAPIQAAINAAALAGGGVVGLPAGTALVSRLLLKSRVVLQGSGWKSLLKQKTDSHSQVQTGTSSGSNGVNTLNDTSKAWTTNQWKNHTVRITGGLGSGQIRYIIANTATQLTIGMESGVGSENWSTTPDATSTYEVLLPFAVIELSGVNEERTAIKSLAIDGNKANQKALNPGIYHNNQGGAFETSDSHHLVEHVQIKDTKGTGFLVGFSVRELQARNVLVWQCDRHGFGTIPEGGTDNRFFACVAAQCGLSGFHCNGTYNHYSHCKAFGNGTRAITDQRHGYLITGHSFGVGCEAQDNDEHGFYFVTVRSCVWTGIAANTNDGDGVRLWDSHDLFIDLIARGQEPGHTRTQEWAVNAAGPTSTNNRIDVQTNLGGGNGHIQGTVGSALYGNDNVVTANARIVGRAFSAYGTVSGANEHFTFGKAGSPASGNPYYAWKTDGTTPPVAELAGWDGATNKTFLRADYGSSRLVLGKSGEVTEVAIDAAQLLPLSAAFNLGSDAKPIGAIRSAGAHLNRYGAAGDSKEYFTFGKTGSPASGNPYYTWKMDSGQRAILEGWDGAASRTFMRADYINNALEIAYANVANVSIGADTTFGSHAVSMGALTASDVSITNDLGINRSITTGVLVLAGSPTNTGANIELYGSAHATVPDQAFYDAAQHTFRLANGTGNGPVSMGALTATGNISVTKTTPILLLKDSSQLESATAFAAYFEGQDSAGTSVFFVGDTGSFKALELFAKAGYDVRVYADGAIKHHIQPSTQTLFGANGLDLKLRDNAHLETDGSFHSYVWGSDSDNTQVWFVGDGSSGKTVSLWAKTSYDVSIVAGGAEVVLFPAAGGGILRGSLTLDGAARVIDFDDDDVVLQRAGVTKLTLSSATATFTTKAESTGGEFRSVHGTAGGANTEHLRWGKTGSGTSGNPYYVWKLDASSTPVATLEGWDGATAREFFKCGFAEQRLHLGSADSIKEIFVQGYLCLLESSPAQLTANQNNYSIGNVSWLRLSSDAARTITGIAGGVVNRFLVIVNVGSNDISFTHDDAASSAANRIITPDGATWTLNQRETALFIYDNTSSRWRILERV